MSAYVPCNKQAWRSLMSKSLQMCRNYAMACKAAAIATLVVQAAELWMRRESNSQIGGRAILESTQFAGAQQIQAVESDVVAKIKEELGVALTQLLDKAHDAAHDPDRQVQARRFNDQIGQEGRPRHPTLARRGARSAPRIAATVQTPGYANPRLQCRAPATTRRAMPKKRTRTSPPLAKLNLAKIALAN
eukprot:5702661-Pleurochrysis_carterae.AAC.1